MGEKNQQQQKLIEHDQNKNLTWSRKVQSDSSIIQVHMYSQSHLNSLHKLYDAPSYMRYPMDIYPYAFKLDFCLRTSCLIPTHYFAGW